jgi:hypothetical protein
MASSRQYVEILRAQPKTFVMPGFSRERRSVPSLVFKRDESSGYVVYRAEVPSNGGAPTEPKSEK